MFPSLHPNEKLVPNADSLKLHDVPLEGCYGVPLLKRKYAAVSLQRCPEVSFVDPDMSTPAGTLNNHYAKLFQVLSKDPRIELQPYLEYHDSRQSRSMSKGKRGQHPQQTATLSCNIYGSMDVYDDLGDFLIRCSSFLQPPVNCDRDVEYRNPQSLSGMDPDPPRTRHPSLESQSFCAEAVDQASDPSSLLETDDVISEREQPSIITTTLYR